MVFKLFWVESGIYMVLIYDFSFRFFGIINYKEMWFYIKFKKKIKEKVCVIWKL